MHIHKLKLERFRGSQSLSLELCERLNVFVGMNGAGKSSILDATAILLSWLVNRIKSSGSSGRPITETDINNGKSSANIEVFLNWNDTEYSWNMAKTRKGFDKMNAASGLLSVSELAKQIQATIAVSNKQVNLPVFVYYPVNRAVLDIPLRIQGKHCFDLLAAYEDALTSGANFRTFFEWFREREDLENEARRDQQQLSLFANKVTAQFPDSQLEAVRNALTQFMPEFKNLTVRRNPLRMEVEKKGTRLSVDQLSDGEKCLMAMVGDMARRMAIANPIRKNPLEGDGVFLIDEIDLHLHPKWQRMVIPQLQKVFPNCQFLISTHSPHVITHVQPESMFLLKLTERGLEALQPSDSYGMTVERVLEDLMGMETTRPDNVSDAMEKIYDQINNGKLAEAKAAIIKLEEQIGADPELVKARVLIKRMELIGK